jgi:hypothetical protein
LAHILCAKFPENWPFFKISKSIRQKIAYRDGIVRTIPGLDRYLVTGSPVDAYFVGVSFPPAVVKFKDPGQCTL